MLDKTSEKILSKAVERYSGDMDTDILIFASDVGLTHTELNSACYCLHKNEYFSYYRRSTIHTNPVIIRLSHNGLHYFEVKRKELFYDFRKSIIVPIIVTILTDIVVVLLKWLLQKIR